MTETKESIVLNPEPDIEVCEEGFDDSFEENFDDVYGFVDKDLFDKTSQILKNAKKGWPPCLKAGPLEGLPIAGVKVLLASGSAHLIDSSEFAFKQAANFGV